MEKIDLREFNGDGELSGNEWEIIEEAAALLMQAEAQGTTEGTEKTKIIEGITKQLHDKKILTTLNKEFLIYLKRDDVPDITKEHVYNLYSILLKGAGEAVLSMEEFIVVKSEELAELLESDNEEENEKAEIDNGLATHFPDDVSLSNWQ